ncbi:MAG: ABC transporter substrate-binding protein [Actinomycetia bacterium]|nr:ABC transporter substrate-binding protein [Actinomycetes bacterium]MCP5033107.1 ABC transporter substrate-binding protein [Actinomycetes bacterium]
MYKFFALLLAFGLIAAACGSDSDDDEATDDDETVEADDNESFDADQSGDDVAEDAGGGESDEDAIDTEGISTRNADSLVLALNDQRYTNQEPKTGGVLIHHWRADTASLDPRVSSTYHLHYRVGPVYQRLYAPASGPDIAHYEQKLEPELAVDFPEISDDGLTYTVKLREGVVWQNVEPVNGRPFVAADVVATMDAYKEGGFQASFLDRVDSIEAVDDHTVQFNLSAPFSPLANFFGNHHMWIMPQEAFDETSGYDVNAKPIGTGPFMLTEREVDVETVYERNPDYWKTDENGVQLPYLDGMRLVIISDQDAALAAFKAGELDVSDADLTIEAQEQLADEYPEGQYFAWLHGSTTIMSLNMDRPEFQNPDVRRAITMSIDRKGMGDAIRGGGTYSGPMNVNILDFVLPEDERAEALAYDLEGAKQLLADAGYADGFEVRLIHTDRYGPAYVAQTEWLAADLEALGLTVSIETLDYGTYFTAAWPDGDYDIQFGPQTPFQEADEWIRGQYSTGGGRNWTGYSDPVLDALIEEQLELTDVDARREKLFEIQRYILDNAVPPIPIWTHIQRKQLQPWVRNFNPPGTPPGYGFTGLESAWLDQ